MGMKLAAVMAVLMFAMGGAFYWYYNDTQERIGVLRENNAKLETAIAISEESIKSLQADMEKFAELNKQLTGQLQKAEAYGDDLRSKLREHDLTSLAIRKPKLLEGKMNGATANLWRDIEKDTGGDGDAPLPQWLQPVPESGTGSASSDENREDSSTTSGEAEASPAS